MELIKKLKLMTMRNNVKDFIETLLKTIEQKPSIKKINQNIIPISDQE